MSLDAFFKVFKESFEKLEQQRFEERDLKQEQHLKVNIRNWISASRNWNSAFKSRINVPKIFGVTVKQKACLDSRRVPKTKTHTARSPVSQGTTLPQMGK